jgi:hypothetical protein
MTTFFSFGHATWPMRKRWYFGNGPTLQLSFSKIKNQNPLLRPVLESSEHKLFRAVEFLKSYYVLATHDCFPQMCLYREKWHIYHAYRRARQVLVLKIGMVYATFGTGNRKLRSRAVHFRKVFDTIFIFDSIGVSPVGSTFSKRHV